MSWEQVVISLQALLKHPVSVGGRTALELRGHAHYLPQTQSTVHLYSDSKLPSWLLKLPLLETLVVHNRNRLQYQSKALVFIFAERHNYSWLKHLDMNTIDLGSGKRMLVKGGKLHSKYQITLPEEFAAESVNGIFCHISQASRYHSRFRTNFCWYEV